MDPLHVLAIGLVAGAGIGVQCGRVLERVTAADPLGRLIRAYRELWRDIRRLITTGRWT